jgi:response regulator NasT
MAVTVPRRAKIAIAEDEPDFRKALSALLTALGHEVVCEAADGAELLAECHEADVDVVIADLDMPVVDGLEAAEQISRRGIPVILLSGHPDADQVNLDHEPVAARLVKPTTSASLEAAIAQALARRPPRS